MNESRTPSAVLKAKQGGRHWTRAEIAERENSEPGVPPIDMVPPEWLDADGVRDFKRWCSMLQAFNEVNGAAVYCNLDSEHLARYVVESAAYAKYTRLSAEAMDADEMIRMHNQALKSLDACNRISGKLGLAIADRCKLVVPGRGSDGEESVLAAM